MDKFVWHSVGEDNLGVTGMSVFLGEEMDSPFISVLRGDDGKPWSAFVAVPNQSPYRVEFEISQDIPISQAWDIAKRKACQLLMEVLKLRRDIVMKEFDNLILGVHFCML